MPPHRRCCGSPGCGRLTVALGEIDAIIWSDDIGELLCVLVNATAPQPNTTTAAMQLEPQGPSGMPSLEQRPPECFEVPTSGDS